MEFPTFKVERYGYFTDPKERRDIYEFSKQLSIYLHDERIPNVVFIERAPRPGWVGLDEYWKNNYPGEQRPNIYFINPEGIDVVGKILQDLSGRNDAPRRNLVIKKLLLSLTNEETLLNMGKKHARDIRTQYEKTYAKLEKEKGGPVALFDNCMHSGETMSPVLNYLRATGYRDIRVVVGDNNRNYSPIKVDKFLTPNRKVLSCYPFGDSEYGGVVKGSNVFSDYDNEADREKVIQLRQEIRRIVKTKGK